jgi:hypothetical protein
MAPVLNSATACRKETWVLAKATRNLGPTMHIVTASGLHPKRRA